MCNPSAVRLQWFSDALTQIDAERSFWNQLTQPRPMTRQWSPSTIGSQDPLPRGGPRRRGLGQLRRTRQLRTAPPMRHTEIDATPEATRAQWSTQPASTTGRWRVGVGASGPCSRKPQRHPRRSRGVRACPHGRAGLLRRTIRPGPGGRLLHRPPRDSRGPHTKIITGYTPDKGS